MVWWSRHTGAVQQLKGALIETTNLQIFHPDKPLKVKTDHRRTPSQPC